MQIENKHIVIQGLTEDGRVFRPSNWAERMSCALSTFKGQRINYSPMLRPIVKDGVNCVLVDKTLEDKHNGLYQSIINFAQANSLKVSNA